MPLTGALALRGRRLRCRPALAFPATDNALTHSANILTLEPSTGGANIINCCQRWEGKGSVVVVLVIVIIVVVPTEGK